MEQAQLYMRVWDLLDYSMATTSTQIAELSTQRAGMTLTPQQVISAMKTLRMKHMARSEKGGGDGKHLHWRLDPEKQVVDEKPNEPATPLERMQAAIAAFNEAAEAIEAELEMAQRIREMARG